VYYSRHYCYDPERCGGIRTFLSMFEMASIEGHCITKHSIAEYGAVLCYYCFDLSVTCRINEQ
jgi:hypothetical protein